MPRLPTAILAAFLLPLAGCATEGDEPMAAGAAEGRACFWPVQATGFQSGGINDDHIHVRVAGGETYALETFGPCPGIDFSLQLGIERGGPGQICQGESADIVYSSPTGPERCRVRMIGRVSEAAR